MIVQDEVAYYCIVKVSSPEHKANKNRHIGKYNKEYNSQRKSWGLLYIAMFLALLFMTFAIVVVAERLTAPGDAATVGLLSGMGKYVT